MPSSQNTVFIAFFRQGWWVGVTFLSVTSSCGAPHIGAELLVAKHSQPLFETQLEPVAAGDTVAGPIVEIFMGDDGFDPFEIAVHCGFRTGQNGGGIKYIQAFVKISYSCEWEWGIVRHNGNVYGWQLHLDTKDSG